MAWPLGSRPNIVHVVARATGVLAQRGVPADSIADLTASSLTRRGTADSVEQPGQTEVKRDDLDQWAEIVKPTNDQIATYDRFVRFWT